MNTLILTRHAVNAPAELRKITQLKAQQRINVNCIRSAIPLRRVLTLQDKEDARSVSGKKMQGVLQKNLTQVWVAGRKRVFPTVDYGV